MDDKGNLETIFESPTPSSARLLAVLSAGKRESKAKMPTPPMPPVAPKPMERESLDHLLGKISAYEIGGEKEGGKGTGRRGGNHKSGKEKNREKSSKLEGKGEAEEVDDAAVSEEEPQHVTAISIGGGKAKTLRGEKWNE